VSARAGLRTERELVDGNLRVLRDVGTVGDGGNRPAPVGDARIEQVLAARGNRGVRAAAVVSQAHRLDGRLGELLRETVRVHEPLQDKESKRYLLIIRLIC
jgi:hypothetical protein